MFFVFVDLYDKHFHVAKLGKFPILVAGSRLKKRKSHSGHGLRMKTLGDMFGLRLLTKKQIYLTKCHYSFKNT